MRPKQRPADRRSPEDVNDDIGPTQLRHQSSVRQRPGAYWTGPSPSSDESDRSPSPPSVQQQQDEADEDEADPELPAAAPSATTTTTTTAPPSRPRRRPAVPPPPPQTRDPSVLLEAEPVLSILVDATPMPEPPERWRPRLTRRKAFILLGIVAVVVAVAVGIAVGTSSGPNSTEAQTGSGDALRDVPGQSPASGCPAWGEDCLSDSSVDAQACIECYNAYADLVTNQTACEEITSLVCAQIDACTSSCGSCGPSIEAYEACQRGSDCFLSCTNASSPTTTPSRSPVKPVSPPSRPPAPAPTGGTPAPTSKCPSENAAVVSCLQENNLDTQACLDCYSPYFDLLTNETTCGELTTLVCAQIVTCTSCGTCGPSIEAYETCNWGSDCFLSCPYPPPTNQSSPAAAPPPSPAPSLDCPTERVAMSDCVRASGGIDSTCQGCLTENRPETIGNCEELGLYTCRAVDLCPECGSCEDEYVALINCWNEEDCNTPIACPVSPPSSTTPAPTTTAVPSSSRSATSLPA